MDSTSIVRIGKIFADHKGISLSTLGRKTANHGLFFKRLQAGHDLTTRRAERVVQYLSDHWPDGLEWPGDIPRPEARGGEAKAA